MLFVKRKSEVKGWCTGKGVRCVRNENLSLKTTSYNTGEDYTSMRRPPAGRSDALYPNSVSIFRTAFLFGFHPMRVPLKWVAN